jgi:hypothetical protein
MYVRNMKLELISPSILKESQVVMVKNNLRLSLCIFILSAFIFVYPAFAEIKVFEKETTWKAAKNQSQEQAERLAIMEAQRQAIEEAGVFISSLTVVKDFRLDKDEITQLASGILRTKTMGVPALFTCDDTFCVRVRTIIQADTSVLGRQIEAFMKDKGALKREEEALKRVGELQAQLANLKGSEVKRLEELNIQALALERDRDRQRLFREEQSLKAKGELSRVEAERLAKEREMQDRINRTLAEQEKTKKEEAVALAAEQDRIKRTQLENEQRWNDLSRKAQIVQDQWVVIDDSLSLRHAVTEAADLIQEISNLKGRLDYQYGENTRNLQAAYARQSAMTKAILPPKPSPKDAFKTTTEYNKRISAYKRQVNEAVMEKGKAVRKLQTEENLKLTQAKAEYLGQQIRVLAPFMKRLQDLQDRKFTLPEGGAMTVDLGEPDPDNNRFPVRLQHGGKSWSIYWSYTDINIAKDFYLTRTSLKAEGLFQIEEAVKLNPKLTVARVTHPGTKETREFGLETPRVLAEIDQFAKMKQEEAAARETSELAARLLARKEIGKDGRFTAYDDGTVLDTRSGLMWAAKDNGSDINWQGANSYCENYRGGGYTDWRMPTQDELMGLYDKAKGYKYACGDDAHLTELIRLTCHWTWASETRDSGAACFRFGGGGYRCWGPPSGSGSSRVLPVRSGK